MSASLLFLLAGCSGAYAPATGRPQIADTPAPLAAAPAPAAAQVAPAPLPPGAPPSDGPIGTAGQGVQAYDRVGYATWYGDLEGEATTASGAAFDPDAIAAAHRTLPLGSIVEVTALDTGRNILVRITDRGPQDARYEIDLTRGAANLLGTSGGATPVRVRAVTASAMDASALARGEAAAPRIDAPPALLVALRQQLPATANGTRPSPSRVASPPPRAAPPTTRPSVRAGASFPIPARTTPPRAAPPPATQPRPAESAPAARGGYVVQVAAFSTRDRAEALARALGGSVQPAGVLWRVRLGPFRDLAAAQRARDGAGRRGYADAQIIPAS